MRDPKAYLEAGRTNPHDPQQMREHPYDFVSLPDEPKLVQGVKHHRLPLDLLSGSLRLVYRTESPLHIGSGFFEKVEKCGLRGHGSVRGIMRSVSGPIFPGSGWKGAIRSRYEAITRSRLTLAKSKGNVGGKNMPKKLYEGGIEQQLTIEDPKVRHLTALSPRNLRLERLSPAEALFGGMGYRGRVLPGEGRILGGAATEPLQVAPMESPRMHRLAKPGKLRSAGENQWKLDEVEGRKFYYDGDLVSKRVQQGQFGSKRVAFENIDFIPAGAEIHIEVRVRSASLAEIGALLVASGYGDDVGIVRFGGFKSVGLGKVKLVSSKAKLRRGGPLNRSASETCDLAAAVTLARSELIDLSALDELHRITTMWRAE